MAQSKKERGDTISSMPGDDSSKESCNLANAYSSNKEEEKFDSKPGFGERINPILTSGSN